MKLPFVVVLLCSARGLAFVTPLATKTSLSSQSSSRQYLSSGVGSSSDNAWQGEIVSGGQIRGCSIQGVGEEPITEWILTIDGYVTVKLEMGIAS